MDGGQGGWRSIDPQFNLLGEVGHHVLRGKGLLLVHGKLAEPSLWLVFGQKKSLCRFHPGLNFYMQNLIGVLSIVRNLKIFHKSLLIALNSIILSRLIFLSTH